MRSRIVVLFAAIFLGLTFVVDALTPQTLVIAILLDVPIVLAALTQSRGLTAALVGISIFADVTAGAINAYRDGYWNSIGLADRALTLLSIVMVGVLCTTLQERAKRVAGLALRDARARREAALAGAGERMRETLSGELVARAVVREALSLMDGAAAHWYPNGAGEIVSAPPLPTAPIDATPVPEIVSVVRRAIDEERILQFTGADVVSRLLLDRLNAHAALAIPVRDRAVTFGVLIVSTMHDIDDEAVSTAWAFAKLAETALAQARLFDTLAERNRELAERQEVIRDLVYALSHDLRTPLSALSLTLRQAREGGYGPLPDEYRDVLSASLGSIDDLRRLAETLLLVARIEAGEHHSQSEKVDLGGLARDVLAEFEAMAQSGGVTLEFVGETAFVQADRADLRRALVNLVANALQHSAAGGTVTVRGRRDDANFCLDVVDDGFGVADDYVPYLFQRFSGDRAGGGSGLGLYLVRRVTEQNHGRASYAPVMPRGSQFTIELPMLVAT